MGSVDERKELLHMQAKALVDSFTPEYRSAIAAALREQPEARGVVECPDCGDEVDPNPDENGETRCADCWDIRRRPAPPSAPVGVIGDAIQHLSKWLDLNECECEASHQCGRAEVERTRDQLRTLAQQPALSAPVGVEDKARAMFEAQADKLAAPWERQWEPTKEHWRAKARVELTQQPAQAAPGWKLAPVEATDAMREAFHDWRPSEGDNYAGAQSVSCQDRWEFRQRYAALLAAAPTPPGDDAAGGGR